MLDSLQDSALIEKVRRWTLWVAICSATLYLLFLVLEAWGAFDTYSYGYYDDYYYSGGGATVWGKIENTFAAFFGISAAILIIILFTLPRRKNEDEPAKKK